MYSTVQGGKFDASLTPDHHNSSLILAITQTQSFLQSAQSSVGDGISVQDVQQEEDDQDGKTAEVESANQGLLHRYQLLRAVALENFGHEAVSVALALLEPIVGSILRFDLDMVVFGLLER